MHSLNTNGDYVEHENAEWLTTNLFHYEALWAEFIGNDGANEVSPARRLRPEFKEDHQLFAQHHYTLALSLLRMREIVKRLDEDTVARIGMSVPWPEYLKDVDQYFMFMAYLGNAVDQVHKMDALLDAKLGSQAKLQPFLEFRHTVIHGPRVPLKTSDFEVFVPKLGGINPRPKEWQQKIAWGQIPEENFVPLTTFCRDALAELMEVINPIHGGMRGALDKWFFPENPTPVPEGPDRRITSIYQIPLNTPLEPQEWKNRGMSGQKNIGPGPHS